MLAVLGYWPVISLIYSIALGYAIVSCDREITIPWFHAIKKTRLKREGQKLLSSK